MRVALPQSLRIASGLLLAALLSIVGYQVFLRISHSPEALLKRADDLSWLNSWIAAAPLYHQAELEFIVCFRQACVMSEAVSLCDPVMPVVDSLDG